MEKQSFQIKYAVLIALVNYVFLSKSVYSPYNDGLCCKDELQMNLQSCEKLANVLNKIANKDGKILYEIFVFI